MTKKILTSYIPFLALTVMLAMVGVMTVHATEVTGTLSSDILGNSQTGGDLGGTVSDDSQVSGNIGGTVSDDSQTSGNIGGTVLGVSSGSGGSSGGGSSGGGGSRGSLSDASTGDVLGAAISNAQTPGFPNAGVAPNAGSPDQSIWSVMMSFLRNALSF